MPVRICLILIALLLTNISFAEFVWHDVSQVVEILSNGEVVVSDIRGFSSDQELKEVYLCIPVLKTQKVELMPASGSYDFDNATASLTSCTSNHYGSEIVISFPQRTKRGKIQFNYKLINSLKYYSDVVQWYWEIIGSEDSKISNYHLQVVTPGAMSNDYSAFVHRYNNIERPVIRQSDDRSELNVSFKNIPAATGVGIRYLMPPNLFVNSGQRPGMYTLMRKEKEISNVQFKQRWLHFIQYNPLALIPALLLLISYFVFGIIALLTQKPKPEKNEAKYRFTPPSNLPPASLAVIQNPKTPNVERAFSATVLDLAFKGFLSIGSFNKEFEILIDLKKEDNALREYEKDVLEYLKRAAKSDPKGKDDFLSFGELANYSKLMLFNFKEEWLEKLKHETEEHFGAKLLNEKNDKRFNILDVFARNTVFLLFLSAMFMQDNNRIVNVVFVVLLVTMNLLLRYGLRLITPIVSKERLAWQSFEATLSDYTIMKQAPYEFFKNWDKYFVYAQALGVSKKYLQNMNRAILHTDFSIDMFGSSKIWTEDFLELNRNSEFADFGVAIFSFAEALNYRYESFADDSDYPNTS